MSVVRASLDDDKAEHVVEIPMAAQSSVADMMIIASGRSSRQVAAMAEHLSRRLRDAGLGAPRIQGERQGDWVLVDAGDVVVHLFRPEVRAYYNLEKMWGAESPPAPVGYGYGYADDGFSPLSRG